MAPRRFYALTVRGEGELIGKGKGLILVQDNGGEPEDLIAYCANGLGWKICYRSSLNSHQSDSLYRVVCILHSLPGG